MGEGYEKFEFKENENITIKIDLLYTNALKKKKKESTE